MDTAPVIDDALLESLLQIDACAICVIDMRGVILRVNNRFLAEFGIDHAGAIGRGVDTLIPGLPPQSDASRPYPHTSSTASDDRTWRIYPIRRSASPQVHTSAIFVSSDAHAMPNIPSDGVRLDAFLRGAGAGTWEWTVGTDRVRYSDHWARMLGLEPRSLDHRLDTWLKLIHPDERAATLRSIHALRGDAVFETEFRMIHADGKWRWIQCRAVVLQHDADGGPALIVGTHVDVTDHVRLVEDLNRARSLAERATRTRDEFIANMSHELRTPLAAIIGFADILSDSTTIDSSHVQTIRRNATHLLTLINDLLDASKIGAEKMTLECRAFDPIAIVTDVCSMLQGRAHEHSVSLSTQMPATCATVVGDETRLRQILVNLVGNAIKFSPAGAVTLTLHPPEVNADLVTIHFEIRDNGIGMTPDQLSRLFERFHQADETTNRRFGGSGLGLAISKSLVDLMGGTIHATSATAPDAERGTTFRVTLTLPVANEDDKALKPLVQPIGPAQLATLRAARVLIAEDSIDSQRLIKALLHASGISSTIVTDGRCAVTEAMAAHRAGTPFDVILMDIQMPLMDGFEATAALRRAGYTAPIVALTAHASAADRQRCILAGCNDVLTKPITKATLLEGLIRTIAPRVDVPRSFSAA